MPAEVDRELTAMTQVGIIKIITSTVPQFWYQSKVSSSAFSLLKLFTLFGIFQDTINKQVFKQIVSTLHLLDAFLGCKVVYVFIKQYWCQNWRTIITSDPRGVRKKCINPSNLEKREPKRLRLWFEQLESTRVRPTFSKKLVSELIKPTFCNHSLDPFEYFIARDLKNILHPSANN